MKITASLTQVKCKINSLWSCFYFKTLEISGFHYKSIKELKIAFQNPFRDLLKFLHYRGSFKYQKCADSIPYTLDLPYIEGKR